MPAARAASGSAPAGLGPQIGDQRDVDAGRLQIERGAVGAVVRGRDDDALADLDAVAVAVTPRGVGEHDARPVVVREDERALDRAGREHHLARAHLPQALARQVGIGDARSVGDALGEPDEILRVVAERRGARQQPHVGRGAAARRARPQASRARLCRRSRRQSRRAASRPNSACSSQRMTRAPLSLAAQRRREARRSGADDEHVAMGEDALIAVGIGLARRRGRDRRRGGSSARRRASRPSAAT